MKGSIATQLVLYMKQGSTAVSGQQTVKGLTYGIALIAGACCKRGFVCVGKISGCSHQFYKDSGINQSGCTEPRFEFFGFCKKEIAQ